MNYSSACRQPVCPDLKRERYTRNANSSTYVRIVACAAFCVCCLQRFSEFSLVEGSLYLQLILCARGMTCTHCLLKLRKLDCNMKLNNMQEHCQLQISHMHQKRKWRPVSVLSWIPKLVCRIVTRCANCTITRRKFIVTYEEFDIKFFLNILCNAINIEHIVYFLN